MRAARLWLLVGVGLFQSMGLQSYELAYYRFEEGELTDIVDGVSGDVHGTHTATYSSDVPVERIARYDGYWDDQGQCERNASSLAFHDGAKASFSSTFVFHQGGAGEDDYYYDDESATLEFWIKAPEQGFATIFWSELEGKDADRFHIFLTGMAIGGEYREADGSPYAISSRLHPIPADVWVHVAIVRYQVWTDEPFRHQYNWYFDGVLDESMTIFDRLRGGDGLPALPDSAGWTLGGRPGFEFTGLIDEVRFHSSALEPESFLNAGMREGDDCNDNGMPDACDVDNGTSSDCNGNRIPDECDVAAGGDCNGNGIPDACDISGETSADCDNNGVPDECDVAAGGDCNGNGIPDSCDISGETSADCDNNGIPDECDVAAEGDCNGNGVPDSCDIFDRTSTDCDGNDIPDECDVVGGGDCNGNGIPDACDLVAWGLDFEGSRDYAVGNLPWALVATDLDGDTATDLITANWNTNDISVLLGKGDGSFEDAVTHPAGKRPWKLLTRDLDGDGAVDVVSVNKLTDDVSVFLGTGSGALRPSVDHAAGDSPGSILAEDVNRDGALDLLTANQDSDDVSVLLGNGDGTFRSPRHVAVGQSPRALVAVDLNGDERTDLVTANALSDNVSVLIGNGDGSFQPAAHLLAGGQPHALFTHDADHNGHDDLIVVNGLGGPMFGWSGGSVAVFPGNGDGTFGVPLATNTRDPISSGVVCDLDGDGDLDAVTAHSDRHWPSDLSILLWGDGDIFEISERITVGNGPVTLLAVDLQADGVPDLVTANQGGTSVSVVQASRDGTFFPPKAFDLGASPRDIVAVDFDGDGDLDLATANAAGTVSVLLNTSTPPASPDCNRNGIPDECDLASGASVDLNEDGTPDECEADCDEDGIPDIASIADGRADDCNTNGIPDHCEIATDAGVDANGNGIPDVCDPTFVRGDCNGDGETGGIADAEFMLTANFLGGVEVPCVAACDANGDGATGGVTDAIRLLARNFLGGVEVPPPFPECAPSALASDRLLGCETVPPGCP